MSAKMLAPFGGYVIADGGTAVGDVFRARRTTGPNGDLVSEEFTINGNPVSPQKYRAAFDAPAGSIVDESFVGQSLVVGLCCGSPKVKASDGRLVLDSAITTEAQMSDVRAELFVRRPNGSRTAVDPIAAFRRR